MDFTKLKELTKKLGGLLVLDGDEPTLVILPYEKYQKMESGEEIPVLKNGFDDSIVANGVNYDEVAVERLNQEISALKEEIRQKEEAELLENAQPGGVFAEAVDPVRDSYSD